MKARLGTIVLFAVCFAAGAQGACLAQQRPGGAPPPGPPPGSGMPGGTPGAPGPGEFHHDGRARGSATAPATAHSSVQFGPVGRWWDNRSIGRSIGLSREQQKRMDTIFDASKPAIVSSYKNFLKEQSKLQALNKESNVDQEHLFAAIDSVNQARAALQKATAQMLLQIKQQMEPAQIEKLEKLQ